MDSVKHLGPASFALQQGAAEKVPYGSVSCRSPECKTAAVYFSGSCKRWQESHKAADLSAACDGCRCTMIKRERQGVYHWRF